MPRAERGAALLEVLAAVAILGIAGLGFVELVAAATRAELRARATERELADAERLLAAHTLLRRDDLDRRLGDRVVGPYVINVQRPERELHRIAIARGDAREVEMLVTVVRRKDAIQ